MTANALSLLNSNRLLVVGQSANFEIALVNAFHEFLIKLTGAAYGVSCLDLRSQLVVAADGYLKAAPAPQKELYQTVYIIGISLSHLGGVVGFAFPGANLACAALNSNAQRLGSIFLVLLEEQSQRYKALVQLRQVLNGDLNIQKIHVVFNPFKNFSFGAAFAHVPFNCIVSQSTLFCLVQRLFLFAHLYN